MVPHSNLNKRNKPLPNVNKNISGKTQSISCPIFFLPFSDCVYGNGAKFNKAMQTFVMAWCEQPNEGLYCGLVEQLKWKWVQYKVELGKYIVRSEQYFLHHHTMKFVPTYYGPILIFLGEGNQDGLRARVCSRQMKDRAICVCWLLCLTPWEWEEAALARYVARLPRSLFAF